MPFKEWLFATQEIGDKKILDNTLEKSAQLTRKFYNLNSKKALTNLFIYVLCKLNCIYMLKIIEFIGS